MFKLIRVALVLFVLIFLPSKSISTSWQDIVKYTEQNNEDIKNAQKSLEISQWQYKKSLTNFAPQILLFSSIGKSSNNMGETTAYQYGLNISQNLFSGFSNIFESKKYLLQTEYQKASYQQEKSNVLSDVRNAYINLIFAKKEVDLYERILDRRNENTRLIKLLYENGKEDKGSYLQTIADLENSKATLSQAQRNLSIAKFKLAQLIGIEISEVESNIELSVKQNYNDNDLEILMKNSPNYIAAKTFYEISEINASQSISTFLPTISLSANTSKTGSNWPPQNENKNITLNFSYSVFSPNNNYTDAIIKFLEKEKNYKILGKTKKEILTSIKLTYNSLLNKLESLSVREKYLSAATERAKIARMKYINGLLSYYEWDNIENNYITSEKELLNAKKDVLLAENEFKNSYGGWK